MEKYGSSVNLSTVLEFGAIEKKMVQTFGDALATVMTEGVFLGGGFLSEISHEMNQSNRRTDF